MPQVNIIAIDVAPSNDFSSVQSGATSSSKNSNKDFAQVIEQHYKSQQTQQSGKKQETSGNKSKLDTDVQPEKDNVQGKSASREAQSTESETGKVTDDEVKTEKLLSSEKDRNNTSIPANKEDDSTQQLMSLLSASDKILKDDVKSDSTVTSNDNIKLPTAHVERKIPEKTELDALLKQVLGGNNKAKTETSKAETSDDSSGQIKADKRSTEQMKVPTEVTNQELK